jgi:hypothetical protein
VTEKIAILVVGMHRSGTSALARTISLLGARLPLDLVGPNEGNPHGHWEPEKIVALNDQMLADAGSDVYSIIDFQQGWFRSPRAAEFTTKAVEILKASFDSDPFIVIKDPRVALLLPIWHQALAELGYRCVHVLPVRHPEVVADSLRRRHLKTIEYDAWGNPRGQAVWLRYTIAAVMNTRHFTRSFINYSDLISDWRSVTKRLASELEIDWPRMGPVAEREIDAFLHQNELADSAQKSAIPDKHAISELSLRELAAVLYSVLERSKDEAALTDEIAAAYRKKMNASTDIVSAYEDLFPMIWRYYEGSRQSEKRNQTAGERIAGMSVAVQNLWQDLTKATTETAVIQQDLGSQTARVVSLEAALDHHGKMLAESNEHRDRYFSELGLANHNAGLVKQELAQAEVFLRQELEQAQARIALAKKDKADAVAAVRAERDARVAEVIAEKDSQIEQIIAEKDRISEDVISQMRLSTSWRLTAPMRMIIGWIKRS